MTEAINFNDFVPHWDKKSIKSNQQLALEQSLRLHLLQLELFDYQTETIIEAFYNALLVTANLFFKPTNNNNSWLVYNDVRVVIQGDLDLKLLFDEALTFFERKLLIAFTPNDGLHTDEETKSVLVKANSALFAAYKFYFTDGVSQEPVITCFGKPISPSTSDSVDMIFVFNKAKDTLKSLLTFQDKSKIER